MLHQEPRKDERTRRDMYKWDKEPRLNTGATSWKLEDIQQDFQGDPRAEDGEASSQYFQ
jgi:hypothetical protein